MMHRLVFGVVVALALLMGGCASPAGPTPVTLSNCDGPTLQPSCPQNAPTPVNTITVPTDQIPIPEDGQDSSLPASIQLTKLDRVGRGIVWFMSTDVGTISGSPYEACNFVFGLSDDGVTSKKDIWTGRTLVNTQKSFPDGSDGMVVEYGPFKYFIVRASCLHGGRGLRTGHVALEVNVQ